MIMIWKFIIATVKKKNETWKSFFNENLINFIELHDTSDPNMTNVLFETLTKNGHST